ncbi:MULTISPECIES: hypothetical protein [unclassified Pseudomonas]|uniref:hypothetical protein n=1 Tax=unclassified Pseudomonas TaxID=196821 RepID=UPI000A1EAD78|nr:MULTISPECIES: hypothetical protein [unclassified Pseudomonas]
MTPFVTRLPRCLGFTSLAIAVVGVLFSLYTAFEVNGFTPFLSSNHPAIWGLVFFLLTNMITSVLNALVWVCGYRPKWFSCTVAVQLLVTIGLLLLDG